MRRRKTKTLAEIVDEIAETVKIDRFCKKRNVHFIYTLCELQKKIGVTLCKPDILNAVACAGVGRFTVLSFPPHCAECDMMVRGRCIAIVPNGHPLVKKAAENAKAKGGEA